MNEWPRPSTLAGQAPSFQVNYNDSSHSLNTGTVPGTTLINLHRRLDFLMESIH